jgi:hypothetical protein
MFFQQLYFSFRNFTWNIPRAPLGRWNWKTCNVETSTFLTNRDHCGDIICGNTKETKKFLQEYGKTVQKKKK